MYYYRMEKTGSTVFVRSPIANLDKVLFSDSDKTTPMHEAIDKLITLDSSVSFTVANRSDSKQWYLLNP